MTRQPRGKNGQFITAERTTETTTKVTERVTVEHHHDDTAPTGPSPIPWAAGWDRDRPGDFLYERQQHRKQRGTQVARCLDALLVWHLSADLDADVPEPVIREARNILRAGPGASPMELERGRSA